MPAATAATTRSRRSREYGAAMRTGLHSSPHLESYFPSRRNLGSGSKVAKLVIFHQIAAEPPARWHRGSAKAARVNLKRSCSNTPGVRYDVLAFALPTQIE